MEELGLEEHEKDLSFCVFFAIVRLHGRHTQTQRQRMEQIARRVILALKRSSQPEPETLRGQKTLSFILMSPLLFCFLSFFLTTSRKVLISTRFP